MNSEPSILSRMLKGYPVKTLKEYFGLTSRKQEDLISDVIASVRNNNIMAFAFENFGFLHQHIYIYEIIGNIPQTLNFAGSTVFEDTISGGVRYINLTFDTTFRLFNTSIASEDELVFRCPVRIKIENKKAYIMINTLERNINHYYSNKVFLIGKDIEDKNIIDRINTAFGTSVSIEPLDLSKGIKFLWEDDFIDAAYVKFKKSKSTTTESMDEEHTLKHNYPDVYDQITTAPLDKHIFKIIKNTEDYINIFATEPRKGKLSITRFPNLTDSVENLIEMIINNN